MKKLIEAIEALKGAYPPPAERGVYAAQTTLFDLYEAARAQAARAPVSADIVELLSVGRNASSGIGNADLRSIIARLTDALERHSGAIVPAQARPEGFNGVQEMQVGDRLHWCVVHCIPAKRTILRDCGTGVDGMRAADAALKAMAISSTDRQRRYDETGEEYEARVGRVNLTSPEGK
jgi:hypothetical protein